MLSDADDTISSLNPRKAPAAARQATEPGENKENVSESFILDDTASDGEWRPRGSGGVLVG